MCAFLKQLLGQARRAAFAPLLVISLSAPLPATGDDAVTEYQVKAAFLYNFSRFVNWPGHLDNTFRLCVIGQDPFDGQLDGLIGKSVHDSIMVVEAHDSTDTVQDCQVLFISRSLEPRLDRIIAAVDGLPILTVSDIASFTDAGGMIGLGLANKKIRFEINTGAAGRAGLAISSKLLSLAAVVKMEPR